MLQAGPKRPITDLKLELGTFSAIPDFTTGCSDDGPELSNFSVNLVERGGNSAVEFAQMLPHALNTVRDISYPQGQPNKTDYLYDENDENGDEHFDRLLVGRMKS